MILAPSWRARGRNLIGSALLLIVSSNCDNSTAPSAALPSVVAVAIDSTAGPIFRTLQLQLPTPAGVEVDYWAAATPRLRVTRTAPSTEHSVFLPRLRPGEVYDYEVRSVGRGGRQGEPFRGQFSTDTLPSELAGLRFTVRGVSSFPLVMLELRGRFNGHVIVDGDGAVVWYHEGVAESFTRRANGDYVLLDIDTGIVEVRPDLTVVAQLPLADTLQMHHEVIATPANTLLFLAHDARSFGDTVWTGEAIWEWSPEAGTLVRRWSAWDFLSPDWDVGHYSTPADWLHANSLALGPRGNILISLPFLNQVISIASDFQSLEWRLGGTNATIPLMGDDAFWFEHTPQEIAPGRVLLFDNGNNRPVSPLYSRALELELDTRAGTATKVWDFRPRPDVYAPIVGSTRRLADGNTVVAFGTPPGLLGASGPISVFEVTPEGLVDWYLRIDEGDLLNYRATPLFDVGGETVVSR